MAKVYMFPEQKKLPKGIEERLNEIAKDYVATLQAAVVIMGVERDAPTEEEFMELIGEAFAKGIYDAINELEKTPS